MIASLESLIYRFVAREWLETRPRVDASRWQR
jgi:hypothetical protein